MSEVAAASPRDRADAWLGAGFPALGRVVAQVAGSAGLVLSLMVYFGWVRTSVLYEVFGIGSTSLALSVQDYALRSVTATVRPLAAVLLVLLVARPAHRMVLSVVRCPHRVGRAVPVVLTVLGIVVTAVGVAGFVGLVTIAVAWPAVPVCLGLGTLTAAYGAALQTRRDPDTAAPTFAVVQRAALAGMVVLTLFWSAAVLAQMEGVTEAERIAGKPTILPGAVVFSPHRLYLQVPGVTETSLPAESEPRYRYRYDGLRLLIRSDGRLFLIPVRWRPGAHAIVLADDPVYRTEFFRGQ